MSENEKLEETKSERDEIQRVLNGSPEQVKETDVKPSTEIAGNDGQNACDLPKKEDRAIKIILYVLIALVVVILAIFSVTAGHFMVDGYLNNAGSNLNQVYPEVVFLHKAEVALVLFVFLLWMFFGVRKRTRI